MNSDVIMVPVSLDHFIERIDTLVELKVKKAIDGHLDNYDMLSNCPETMSLKEAERITGIKVNSMKYHANNGTIELMKPDTGSKYSRSRISKKELLKLLMINND